MWLRSSSRARGLVRHRLLELGDHERQRWNRPAPHAGSLPFTAQTQHAPAGWRGRRPCIAPGPFGTDTSRLTPYQKRQLAASPYWL
ncbi:hypothetical protein SAMN05216267_102715 [Actinacidiphila rubida]|uniref:Uncharacterized protein n=1 Tax=Actinacidiphila rubida TaxID=310780 RepID=A0A1H8PUQ8_9ACTN|nr:hypothetical protein SAMN05216267_102715 [Actinacidiphila rubida]